MYMYVLIILLHDFPLVYPVLFLLDAARTLFEIKMLATT